MSLFDPDHATCDGRRCDRFATVVTPNGLSCDHHCPEEHKPRAPGRSVLRRIRRTLDEKPPGVAP